MTNVLETNAVLPPGQKAIGAEWLHPRGAFLEFETTAIEQPISDRFEEIVRRYPEQIAVKTQEQSITYAALNQTANRAARSILARCGDRLDCIALLIDRGATLIAGMLGALKAGKIDVMLDPANPLARMKTVLEDSQARLIVSDNQNLSMARELAENRLQLLNLDELDGALGSENLGRPLNPHSPCRVIYTSGSTGEPKGVVLDHRRVLHGVMNNTNGCFVCAGDRVALLTSPGTAQGMAAAYMALLNGATVCFYNLANDGLDNLAAWVNQEKITCYISVPAVFRRFASALGAGQEFPHLRVIKLGADQVRKSDVELFKAHFPNCLLKIFLSATETGNICQLSVDRGTDLPTDAVPVGYPVEGIEILLLDEQGRPVGSSEIGEIAVRSRYLALGYWRKPDLTREKFVPDPKGDEARIFRTGDLGRMTADGCLEHLGRKDACVKIRGFSVELSEVEAALMSLANVKEAAVVARGKGEDSRYLAAYVVPESNSTLSPLLLNLALRKKLPGYMLPQAFVILLAMPLTPTGKIDRKALPDPAPSQRRSETQYVGPRNAVEASLAEIWSEALNLERVGIHDDFIDLGGNSLLAAQVIAKVNQVFGIDLSLRSLLDLSTLAGLAGAVAMLSASKGRSAGKPTDGRTEESGEL